MSERGDEENGAVEGSLDEGSGDGADGRLVEGYSNDPDGVAVHVADSREDDDAEDRTGDAEAPNGSVDGSPQGAGVRDRPHVTMDAREAFAAGDKEASRAFHEAKVQGLIEHEEAHGGIGSDYVKSIVFGGLDGIITTFAIVAAVAGANLSTKVIILMGFSNVIADGISMGMGDFLSSKAEMDYVLRERAREQWEYDEFPEGEVAEMVEIYKRKGFDEEDAKAIIGTYTKKPEYGPLFVNHMMVEELGHMVPEEGDNPAMDGLVTFCSFLFFGSIPMWLYVIFNASGYNDASGMFAIACVATGVTLFLLGAFKARVTKESWWKSGLLMMLNGGLAAAAAYLVGWGLEQALGVKAAAA